MRVVISQMKEHKNRLKITGTYQFVYVEAQFLTARGYFRLLPVGTPCIQTAWQQFWDVWDFHKDELKMIGLYVKKEKRKWVINYTPPETSEIELDKTLRF